MGCSASHASPCAPAETKHELTEQYCNIYMQQIAAQKSEMPKTRFAYDIFLFFTCDYVRHFAALTFNPFTFFDWTRPRRSLPLWQVLLSAHTDFLWSLHDCRLCLLRHILNACAFFWKIFNIFNRLFFLNQFLAWYFIFVSFYHHPGEEHSPDVQQFAFHTCWLNVNNTWMFLNTTVRLM